MTYNFESQLQKGETHEQTLDGYFSDRFTISPVSMDEQRHGIDRTFVNRETGATLKVEYKADSKAASTGNAFVETVSVDTTHKAGWAFTSQADFLVYFVPPDATAYVIRTPILKGKVVGWSEKYPERSIPNNGYNTIGILVPLSEFEKIAETVVCL